MKDGRGAKEFRVLLGHTAWEVIKVLIYLEFCFFKGALHVVICRVTTQRNKTYKWRMVEGKLNIKSNWLIQIEARKERKTYRKRRHK